MINFIINFIAGYIIGTSIALYLNYRDSKNKENK